MKKLSFLLVVFLLVFTGVGCSDDGAATKNKPASAKVIEGKEDLAPAVAAQESGGVAAKLPKLIDFGSKQCRACKAMEPVLESCMNNYADQFTTEFVDVWVAANHMFAKAYKIQSIPTQIFLNEEGKELFRNVGFISEEDILAKWKELGFDFAKASSEGSENANQNESSSEPATVSDVSSE